MDNQHKTAPVFFATLVFWIVFFTCLFFLYRHFFPVSRELNFSSSPKNIFLLENGLPIFLSTRSATLSELLQEKNLSLSEHDQIFPEKDTLLFPGMHIIINRSVFLKIKADRKESAIFSAQKTVAGVLSENNISLGRLDQTSIPLYFQPVNQTEIIVTRINIEEKTVYEDIDYKTVRKEDSKLGWREEKIEQKGEKGRKEIKYKITYKNNQEISRVILEKNVIQEPKNAIIVKGTYMQLGKPAKGQGTWYAFKGGLFAASTTLPRGSFAKVTNTTNGRSVVVEINDYGPQGKGRIIDLDKVAFAKIADLGAGVIGVKVEPVLN